MSDREASELARKAWEHRPRSAADHVATPSEGLAAATGLSSGTLLVLGLSVVAACVLITLYVFVWRG